jgi:HK97 family phage prohead protease
VSPFRVYMSGDAPISIDRATRTVAGLAVPWATPGLVQGVDLPLVFVRGSLEIDNRARLLRGHDPNVVVGRPLWWGDQPGGLRAGFQISRTPEGDDMLVDAEDRIRDGLSVGADLFEVIEQGGFLVVRSGMVREVSVVGMPAYASARIE